MSASPSNMPSVDAAQIHPEFGYFAPTMRFRRQLALTLKGGLLGALAGAVAMFVVSMDREEEKAVAMLATPVAFPPVSSMPAQMPAPTAAAPAPAVATTRTPARPARMAVTEAVAPPVRFVPETIALPAVTPRDLQLRGSMSPEIAATASKPAPRTPSTVGASPAASELAVAPATAAKVVAKPKKKVVRRSPSEPDPRAAFAGPPQRRFGLPIFGFGW